MAPNNPLRRHNLYKAGTDEVLEWLRVTARSCGVFPTVVRLPKGHTGHPVKIPTRQLLTLAKAIASADPPIAIPPDILQLAQDVIVRRQAHADWYAHEFDSDDSEVEEQNRSHAHFIDILTQIYRVLTLASKRLTEPRPQQETKLGIRVGSLSKSLARPEVEEPLGVFAWLRTKWQGVTRWCWDSVAGAGQAGT